MKVTPGVPSYLREMNERRTLEVLRNNGSMHAAEIARNIGLSRTTTADILRGLVESGLITEYLPGEGDSKRARSVFEAVSDLRISLGIDIGSRFIRASVGDLSGNLLSHHFVEVKGSSLSHVKKDIKVAVEGSLKEAGYTLRDVISICVAAPGVINQTNGVVAIAGTVAALDGVNLGQLIKDEFGINPIIENDVNVLTVAEQAAGFGRKSDNFAVISVGMGLGAGLVLNGRLHRGHHGAAGEVFYVPFGDPRDSHRTETNPSGDSIASIARSLAARFKKSELKEPYSTVDILNAARNGDDLGMAVIEQESHRIALYIASISAVTDVEIVVLSGGIGRRAEFFIKPIRSLVSEIIPFPPLIEVSQLGDTGILIGAIKIATVQACEKVFAEMHVTPSAGAL